MTPLSGSISTSAMWQPFGKVGAGRILHLRGVEARAPCRAAASRDRCAAFATSNRSTWRSVPTMRNCPSPNSMSAADASSRFAAICLPLSMILSEASCSAEPPTGSAREPPVSPRGERSDVAIDDVDAVGIDAEPVGDELLVGGDEAGAVFLVAHHEIDAVALELDRGGLGEAAAAALGVGRHADAAQLAALLALAAPRLEALPVGLLHRGVHDLLELAGVEGELGRRRVGDGLRRNEIDAADLVRRHVQFARRRIDQALDQVGRLGPARRRDRRTPAPCWCTRPSR